MLAKRVGFYVVLPLLVGLMLGGNQAGLASFMPWSWSVVYWIGMSLGVWTIFHLSTMMTAYLLRPWTGALVLVLLLGALIGSFPARAAIYWYSPFFEAYLTGGRSVRPMPPASLTAEFLLRHLQLWSPLFILWAAANWAADRWLGFPRYGKSPPTSTRSESGGGDISLAAIDGASVGGTGSPSATAPLHAVASGVFLSRLPSSLGRNLLALKAEDHYVRVYTDKGDTLVLCRINDAIAEVSASGLEGLRVHRSWWVAVKAVQQADIQGRGLLLTLHNGLQVPVSQTYKEFVRRSGLIASTGAASQAAD
jgi:hypothetical protein